MYINPKNKNRRLKRRLPFPRWKLILGIAAVFIIVVTAINLLHKQSEQNKTAEASKSSSEKVTPAKKTEKEELAELKAEAKANGYPAEIIKLLDKNPETKEFVADYKKKKNTRPAEKIADSLDPGEIPSLIQWDERWGYSSYGTSTIAASGCGPTCMSMVIAGLSGDVTATPYKLAKYSEANSFLDENSNTYWTFMNEAATSFGITAEESIRDDAFIQQELQAGHPVICSVGPGDFTDAGHFIVLTGFDNGNVTLNDPFSIENSEKTWVYAEIADQIREVWAYSKSEN